MLGGGSEDEILDLTPGEVDRVVRTAFILGLGVGLGHEGRRDLGADDAEVAIAR